MERETKLSFGQIQREMGVTSGDKLAAMRYQATSYMRQVENSPLETIRTMSRQEMKQALGERSLAQQAEGLEKVTKIWTGMHAAIAATRAVTSSLRKDWDGVGEAIRSLPFGIGSLAGAVMDLKAEWTGANKEIEKFNEEARNIDRNTAYLRKYADTLKSVREETSRFVGDAASDVGGIGRVGLDADLYGITASSSKTIRAIEEERARTLRGYAPGSVERNKLSKSFDARIKAETDRAAALRADARKKAAQSEAEAVFDTQGEIDALRLQLAGRGEDARIRQIWDSGMKEARAEREVGRMTAAAAIEERTKLMVRQERNQYAEARKKAAEMEADAVADIEGQIGITRLQMAGRYEEARVQQIIHNGAKAANAERRAGREVAAARIEEMTKLQIEQERTQQELEAGRNRLMSRRDALSGRLSGLQDEMSAVSSQRLPLLTAFANPGIYTTGGQQRENAIKPGLDAIKRELEEVNRQLRDDKAVRVGNN